MKTVSYTSTKIKNVFCDICKEKSPTGFLIEWKDAWSISDRSEERVCSKCKMLNKKFR